MKQRQVKSDTLSIYDYDKRIDRTYKLIRKELSDENIKLIENYDSIMINEQISKAGRHKHLQTLLNLSRMIGKDWSETTQSDINGLVKEIIDRYADPRGKETHSSHDHKKVLKIFFRWFKLGSRSKNDVGDPIETKGIKIKRVASAITRDNLIISNDDRRKLVSGCNGNLRNEALIDCALDVGPRAGEILNLKLKHVTQDKYGYVLKVDGKTGQRPVRIIEASPKLAAWLNAHPMKKDPDAPLWPQQTKQGYGKPLTYAAARQVVLKAADNVKNRFSDFNKRVTFTIFRHSEATRVANFMTQAQMTKRHGWVGDSKMPDRYVHLINADVDNALFKHHGIKTTEDEDNKSNAPKICSICEMPNSFDAELCSKCSKPLDLQTALQLDEQEKIHHQSLLEKMDNMQKEFNKKIERLENEKIHLNDVFEGLLPNEKDSIKRQQMRDVYYLLTMTPEEITKSIEAN